MFDYDGALELARRLWALADQCEGVFAERHRAAARAQVTWTGPAAADFADRHRAEIVEADEVCLQLRAEANRWAAAWVDAANGDDDHGRSTPVEAPTGPGFEPVSGFGE